MRKLFSRGAGAVAVVMAVGLGAVGCSAERSGTLVPVKVTVGDCEPIEGATVVTWSGVSTGSVRVVYSNASGETAPSDWMNVTVADAGEVRVRTPAAALTGLWTVATVFLAPRSSGKGQSLERQFEDCGIVTVQTLPPTSDTVLTNAVN